MPILGIIASQISGHLGVPVESIVIAGGGGGGGAGGGAGGLLYTANTLVPLGVSQTVTVGAGGPGSFGPHQMGRNSVFGSLTATGGGKSDGTVGAESINGGSGGGSSTPPNVAGGTGISGQGFNGGAGQPAGGGTVGFGGGGGAGGVGSNGASSGTPLGPGGPGSNSYSTWLSAISSAMAGAWQTATAGGRIAGGGGGGAGSGTVGFNPNAGAGGSGGGGAGAVYAAGGFAVTNTGGGGGGSYGTGGGNGASGLVIIRYSSSLANASSTTGSPALVTSGGYKYYVWTGSGSITF